ncbi:MAG: hypothetical protein RIA10_05965, partial [Amphiplicatus sp.]
MKHRIALDMGETSIGWAVFELAGSDIGSLKPLRLVDLGVQLFSNGRDPKTGDPLAAARREPKAMRRRRDRTLQRRAYLLSLLESSELLPPAGPDRDQVMALDPYKLRARGVSEMLTLHEFGRALFHLNQRRGFKSNRKTDPEEGEEGKIASASERLREELAEKGLRTLGQFLAARQSADKVRDRQAVRIRLNGKGAQAYYDFYPMRAMVEEEFDILWGEQSKHHPALTEELRDKIRAALLFQRPLKDPPVGRCS